MEEASAGNAVSPHIASLAESLALVPPAAVSAIIDCVLASSDLSPSILFHSLLHAFPDLSEAHQSDRILSHISALCHLIKSTSAPPDALRLFILRVIVPQLEVIDPGDSELLSQIEAFLCDVVSKTQSWVLTGETLVPVCLRSLGLCMGMVENEGLDIHRWSREFSQGFTDSKFGALPLPTACHILTSLLESALTSGAEIQSSEQKWVAGLSPLDGFTANLIWDLSKLALKLVAQSSESRSCAIHLLLPSVFSSLDALGSVRVLVHGSLHTLSRRVFSREIWECCMSLFSLGRMERLDAYSILSVYLSSCHMKGHDKVSLDNINREFDLRAQKEFWEEIRRGLVDKDASVRKQALYILKISLIHSSSSEYEQCSSNCLEPVMVARNGQIISCDGSEHVAMTRRGKWANKEAESLGVGKVCHLYDHNLSIQDRWKVFLLLYEMLEEYGTHLVEAAWTHQVSLLFQSRPLKNYLNLVTDGIYQVQMETVEGIFNWLAVLWERGLFHENPQVRYLIMQSFLEIDWEKCGKCAQKVPKSFVLGPLILGLNDVVHHKDFGVKGVYTSKTMQSATKFLCEFSRRMSLSERASFVFSLASIARQEAFGRAGLMALTFCIASAACQSSPCSGDESHYIVGSSVDVEQVKSAQDKILPCSSADLLDVLGTVIERSKQHFNPKYRLQVCEQVLKTSSCLINICDVPGDVLLHFLSSVPQEFTDSAGPLREMVRQWLTQINSKCCIFGSVNTKTYSLENFMNFPASFVKREPSPDVSAPFDDDEVDAWLLEAQRWTRVLFLVITEEKHLEPIFMLLQNYCSSLCKQDHIMEWVPVKLLLLILSLVEELQSERKKFICSTKVRAHIGFDMTKIMDHSSPLVTNVFCKNISGLFLLIMEELVSFSKLVSPIFWSAALVKDTHLPCSVKGKLGGPSQRRLASCTTSAVLQAILSIRTVACISSWCAQLRRYDCLDPSFAFLWDFSWKVIQSPNHYSETGAEIRLAAYEALASAMSALSTSFNPVVFDFIHAYNKSLFPNEEDRPLLDPLVLNFLSNINDLLANRNLARSRRAVLIKSKWFCLDCLLSIPFKFIQNGFLQRSAYPLFSDSTLRSTFVDIVESLENAGEDSVLSMLRSVRLILGLLYSGTSPIISSCTGVSCEMMLQLVHSSWILHLSCNKRRVAPIAALLSGVLHHFVFSDLSMHEAIGGKEGPLKWFIEKLFDEGIRSPRTIRLTALHLSGLWLLYPKTVKYYIKELKLLSLYGSVAFDEDFEAELSENCEARMEVSLLAQSPDRELTEVFINTEMYARVSVAVLFYELAKLVNRRDGQEIEDSLSALHCGKLFLLELLDSAVNDRDISKELYKKYSGVHRRKVRAWQMLCILSHFVEKDIVEEVTSNMHICLYRNNLPAVRQFLETFAVQIYLKFPSLAEEQLIPIFYDYNMRPQALSSYVLIAANVILHASELPIQMKHLNELLPPIVPFLTSHHHSLRGFTQLLVHYVLCKLWPALRPTSSEAAPLEMKCFDDLKSYLDGNIDCVRLRASMEGFLDAFDPKTSATPAGIFNALNKGSDFECVPISLMELVITFLNDVRDDLRSSFSKDAMEIKNESLSIMDTCKNMEEAPNVNGERISPVALKDLSMDFQKKITLQEHVRQATNFDTDCFLGNAELSRLLLDMDKEDQLLSPVVQSRIQAMERIRRSQQPFVLVASLLDRIPNLAGLARTCEIFKAAGLAIADASIIQDKQFQLISVTAEKWVPIIEVPVSSMKAFLEKKRREGFSILGLEQTANSTPLDKYSFPTKTVLVLGREKEGIPVDIINALDACVEIPQLGTVRSLNVHVSGAIALWEYTRQRKSKQP